MNRDWLTLAFGIGLVTLVVGLSVRQNVQWGATAPAEPQADAAAPDAIPPSPPVVPAAASTGAAAPPPARAEAPSPASDARRARFDVSVPVVHKHRFGSCDGTLRATNDDLIFASPNKEDSFTLPFKDVDRFDMSASVLSVRRRGGRTWNFTGPSDRPESLVAVHRAVERARR